VVAEPEVATSLLPGRRSEMLVLRPCAKQLRKNCRVFVCFALQRLLCVASCFVWHRVLCGIVFCVDRVLCGIVFCVDRVLCGIVFCVDLRTNSDYFTVQH
jgi:hypothetical protein